MDNLENIHQRRRRDLCIFIWENYENQLTLKDIANALSISERTCERVIHDHLHSRLKDLINAVRFYKTIDHYEYHKGNLIKSAMDNGFTDRRNFQNWWTKWMNIPLNHAEVENNSLMNNMESEYKELIDTIMPAISKSDKQHNGGKLDRFLLDKFNSTY